MYDKAKKALDVMGSIPSHIHALIILMAGVFMVAVPHDAQTKSQGAALVTLGAGLYSKPEERKVKE